jgi:hypothetical protein
MSSSGDAKPLPINLAHLNTGWLAVVGTEGDVTDYQASIHRICHGRPSRESSVRSLNLADAVENYLVAS